MPLKSLLEDVVSRLGYSIRYDRLEDGSGGHYRLREKKEVVIDSRLTDQEKVDILANILQSMDTSGHYLPPVIRKLLSGDQSSDEWDY